MAININVANSQAWQLSNYAAQLRSSKDQLVSYKNSLNANWQGQEVPYIINGIDKAIAEIDDAIRQLNSLSTDVQNTAATIKREDDAAAAAARAAAHKQQRIRTAQTNYDKSVAECDELYKQREELEKKLSTLSGKKKTSAQKELDELVQKIQEAETKRTDCYNTLLAAKR